jgi:flagellar biosynthesis protein FlhA
MYYSLLVTVWLAQIPSMLLSTATAIIVTRVSGEQDMSAEVSKQLTNNPKVLYVAAGIIGAMGIVPGMPNLVFLSIATLAGRRGLSSFPRRDSA